MSIAICKNTCMVTKRIYDPVRQRKTCSEEKTGSLIYLGIVGHERVLESIRATVQALQRKKLFLQYCLENPSRRERCIEDQACIDMLITNPRLVPIGLDRVL